MFKKLLLMILIFCCFNILQARTFKFTCYETIGQSLVFGLFGTRYYTYKYCVDSNRFHEISELVNGIYKPKPDSWNNCITGNCKYRGIVWHTCNDKDALLNRGYNIGYGRVEYSYPDFSALCWQNNNGGPIVKPPPPPPPPPPEVKDELIFWNDLYGDDGKVYTQTSGKQITIYVRSKVYGTRDRTSKTNGKSGLRNAQCLLTTNNKKYTVNSQIAGNGVRFLRITPPNTGHYSFTCTGVNEKGKSINSITQTFYAAPAKYDFNIKLSSRFGVTSISANDIAPGGLNKVNSFGSTSGLNILMSDKLLLSLDAKVKTYNNTIDTGVNSYLPVIKYPNFNIRNSNVCPVSYILNTSNVDYINYPKFNNGVLSIKNSNIFNMNFIDIGNGSISLTIRDKDIESAIYDEGLKGNCSSSSFSSNGMPICPYPPKVEFTFNNIKVFPANYKVELRDNNENIKLLYYGQGNDYKLENTKIVRLSAIASDGSLLKNNIQGCSAMDMNIDIKTKQSDNLSIQLLDKNGNLDSKVLASDFKTNSTATKEKILSIVKGNGNKFLPNEVKNPIYTSFGETKVYYSGKENDPTYPKYLQLQLGVGEIAMLRGRINLIDADNASDFTKMPVTKVVYEFYCKSCDLNKLANITGSTGNYEHSPTAYDWYIDKTFSKFNKQTRITNDNIDTNNISVKSTSNINNGIQTIEYNKAPKGQYEVKVKQDSRANNPFPSYLLYNRYYDGTINTVSNTTSWGTSSKVLVYEELKDNNIDYGLDTGNAKNTRGANRIGGL